MLIAVLRPFLLMAGMVGLAALAAGLFGEVGTALAVSYGGGVALINAALLYWRWRQGVRDFHCDADKHLRLFYRSSMERFFVVMTLLAVGFVWLDDEALALLAGFVVGQVAWMLASPTLRERT